MSKKLKVLTIFGTRPELIKLAPVIHTLASDQDRFISVTCTTAQHRQMIDQLLANFDIGIDHDLDIMKGGQSLGTMTAVLLEKLDRLVDEVKPDWILVQGDTTTAMAASLIAFYHKIRLGHVEAGLRSFDKWAPFPEEVNRKITSIICDLHFTPTEGSRQNLLKEGVPEKSIMVTGNTVVDAIAVVRKALQGSENPWRVPHKKLILFTAHRRENHGAPFAAICRGIRRIAQRHQDEIEIIYPVHPNPNIHDIAFNLLQDVPNIRLIPPLDYYNLLSLMATSFLIITDSGGIQEEAPSFSVPTLVLRETTERPEGVAAGVAKLVGHHEDAIVDAASELIHNQAVYQRMCAVANPYGDGLAAQRIVAAISRYETHL